MDKTTVHVGRSCTCEHTQTFPVVRALIRLSACRFKSSGTCRSTKHVSLILLRKALTKMSSVSLFIVYLENVRIVLAHERDQVPNICLVLFCTLQFGIGPQNHHC